MTTTTKAILRRYYACAEAIAWVNNKTPYNAYRQCYRGDWLLWIAVKLGVDKKLVVAAACDCAETVLHLVLEGEDKPATAIVTARKWVAGKATIEEVRIAARGANAAYAAYAANAANAADYAAVDATNAAAYAADAAANTVYAAYAANAANAADYAAVDATNAAAYAADAAAYAANAAADAAKKKKRLECARLVRKRIPWSEFKKQLPLMDI